MHPSEQMYRYCRLYLALLGRLLRILKVDKWLLYVVFKQKNLHCPTTCGGWDHSLLKGKDGVSTKISTFLKQIGEQTIKKFN